MASLPRSRASSEAFHGCGRPCMYHVRGHKRHSIWHDHDKRHPDGAAARIRHVHGGLDRVCHQFRVDADLPDLVEASAAPCVGKDERGLVCRRIEGDRKIGFQSLPVLRVGWNTVHHIDVCRHTAHSYRHSTPQSLRRFQPGATCRRRLFGTRKPGKR